MVDGQAKPEASDIDKLCKALKVDNSEVHAVLGEGCRSREISVTYRETKLSLDLVDWPQRGLGPMPPTDPLLYRLYEVIVVYGQPLKVCLGGGRGNLSFES